MGTVQIKNSWRSPGLITALGLCSIMLGISKVAAQTEPLPVCTSPEANEFLVLVFTPSPPLREEVRQQVGRTLPPAKNDLIVCQYGGNVLSRIGGFETQAEATDWAEYFDQAVGLPLMVITPVSETTDMAIAPPEIPSLTATDVESDIVPDVVLPTEITEPEAFGEQLRPERTIPVAALNANVIETEEIVDPFNPQALSGEGFGILVDYGDNPAIATDLQAVVTEPIQLVIHGTRGYLMAAQVNDEARLIELLNLLNQNNFVAIAVPVPQIILLKSDLSL